VQPQVSALGVGAGRLAIRSRRSALEKRPWKELLSLTGAVETQFVHPLYVGDTVLPYGLREPQLCVAPWDGERLLHGGTDRLDQYPGLAQWWRRAESIWTQHRSSDRLTLVQQLDYRRKLSQQFPVPPHRVVYSASGMYLAAARIDDPTAVIEHMLYWAAASGIDEARYLTAVLNSDTLTRLVRPLQSRGEHNPRHFDKYIFRLAIPVYDPRNENHRALVELAEQAEQVAAGLDLPESGVAFQALRRRVREALGPAGVGEAIEDAVGALNLTVYDTDGGAPTLAPAPGEVVDSEE